VILGGRGTDCVKTKFREHERFKCLDVSQLYFVTFKVYLVDFLHSLGICSPAGAKISKRNLQYPTVHGGDALLCGLIVPYVLVSCSFSSQGLFLLP